MRSQIDAICHVYSFRPEYEDLNAFQPVYVFAISFSVRFFFCMLTPPVQACIGFSHLNLLFLPRLAANGLHYFDSSVVK